MDKYYTRNTPFLELGSTSIKFYVVSATGERAGEVERELKVPWELGYDVFGQGRISHRTISHCLATLKEFRELFPDLPFQSVTAVGTAALREAQNVEILQRVIWDEFRVKIHIIEGGIEAFLLETGYRDMVESYPTALFDLGGGSLELIEYLTRSSTRKTSLPLGAIRLHSRLRRTRDLFEYISEGRKLVERTLDEYLVRQGVPSYPELIGTGGTVRAVMNCVGRDECRLDDLQELIQREIHGPVWDQLEPHRRKLLLPGLLAIEGIFLTLEAGRIVHRKASVKRGLASFMRILPSTARDEGAVTRSAGT